MKSKIIVLLILGIYSCTDIIEIDLKDTYSRCVIFGSITTDTTAHTVVISKSASYFSNIPIQPISQAKVYITDGDIVYLLSEDINNPGYYRTDPDVYGEIGKTYSLFVENVDLNGDGKLSSYKATDRINPVMIPDSIEVLYKSPYDWSVKLYGKDPEESEDNYIFKVYKNGILITDSLTHLVWSEDFVFNGNYISAVIYDFEWMLENNENIKLNLDDEITLAVCGVTKDYLKFIKEAQVSSRPSIPLISPPLANPRSNINNGGIGYFSAYSVSYVSARPKQIR